MIYVRLRSKYDAQIKKKKWSKIIEHSETNNYIYI